MNKRLPHIIIISDNQFFSNLMRTMLSGLNYTELNYFESIEAAEEAIFNKNNRLKLVILRIDKIIQDFQLGAIKKLNQHGEELKMIVLQKSNEKLVAKSNKVVLKFLKNYCSKLFFVLQNIIPKT